MSRVSRAMHAAPRQVWDVLADGWLYPLWVVGASRMREVDNNWPQEGAKLHHSVGTWPVLIDDTTTVTVCQPLALLGLRARAWPGGEASVTLELAGHGDETTVTIHEDAVSGPGTLLPRPLRQ